MKTSALIAPVLLCAALSACSDTATQVVCPDRASPAVVVRVVDPFTNASVSAEASGTWTSGTRSDSLVHVPSAATGEILLAAYGPPGTYEVRVVRPGHPVWVRGGIVVTQGLCGPQSADLTAVHAAD